MSMSPFVYLNSTVLLYSGYYDYGNAAVCLSVVLFQASSLSFVYLQFLVHFYCSAVVVYLPVLVYFWLIRRRLFIYESF
jgi:hypothetical protein